MRNSKSFVVAALIFFSSGLRAEQIQMQCGVGDYNVSPADGPYYSHPLPRLQNGQEVALDFGNLDRRGNENVTLFAHSAKSSDKEATEPAGIGYRVEMFAKLEKTQKKSLLHLRYFDVMFGTRANGARTKYKIEKTFELDEATHTFKGLSASFELSLRDTIKTGEQAQVEKLTFLNCFVRNAFPKPEENEAKILTVSAKVVNFGGLAEGKKVYQLPVEKAATIDQITEIAPLIHEDTKPLLNEAARLEKIGTGSQWYYDERVLSRTYVNELRDLGISEGRIAEGVFTESELGRLLQTQMGGASLTAVFYVPKDVKYQASSLSRPKLFLESHDKQGSVVRRVEIPQFDRSFVREALQNIKSKEWKENERGNSL